MKNPFAIRMLKFGSGERFPILIDPNTSQPDFDTTVYVLTQLRATNKATNTITHHLRAIIVLKLFLVRSCIDLDERINSGQLLLSYELDELTKICKQPVDIFLSSITTVGAAHSKESVIKVNFRHKQANKLAPNISAQTAANRIHAIRDFLGWLTDIDFRGDTETIARRADDVEDPRLHQPVIKTHDRKISLRASGEPRSKWVAIDDKGFLFRPFLPNLVQTRSDKGFDEIAENQLRNQLANF